VVKRIAALVERRRVLGRLIQRDLRIRYVGSWLGYVWTVLDPLLMAMVYFVVFGYILNVHRKGDHPYLLYLLSGLLPWQWFNSTVLETSSALTTEGKLIRSTNLPREIWVVRVVLSKGVEYLFTLPILIGFALAYALSGQAHLDWELVFWPLGFLLQTLLLVGLGLFLAPVTVLVTDTRRLVRIFLRFMFYFTPILWALRIVPGALGKVLELNPLVGIFELYRAGLFSKNVYWPSVAISAVDIMILFAIGMWVFARLERQVLKEI
jgi:ABC-2 type transport system permease protein